MKELQKYYTRYEDAHEDNGDCLHQCTAIYIASEADAHIDRKLHSLRLKLIDADGENGQLIGALVDAMNHITELKRQHAEEIERLKAGQRQIEMIRDWNDAHFKAIEKQAERYEKLRRLSRYDALRLFSGLDAAELDVLVDKLPASGEAPASRKGDYGQECNRKVCKRSPATWHNHGTNRYYCEPCGKLINAHNPEIEPPLCSPAIGEAQKQPKTLLDFGYAPGGYFSTCLTCNAQIQDVDKRCYCCKPCAQAKLDKWNGREASADEQARRVE